MIDTYPIIIEYKFKKNVYFIYFKTFHYVVVDNKPHIINNPEVKYADLDYYLEQNCIFRLNNFNSTILPLAKTKEEFISNIEKILQLQAFI